MGKQAQWKNWQSHGQDGAKDRQWASQQQSSSSAWGYWHGAWPRPNKNQEQKEGRRPLFRTTMLFKSPWTTMPRLSTRQWKSRKTKMACRTGSVPYRNASMWSDDRKVDSARPETTRVRGTCNGPPSSRRPNVISFTSARSTWRMSRNLPDHQGSESRCSFTAAGMLAGAGSRHGACDRDSHGPGRAALAGFAFRWRIYRGWHGCLGSPDLATHSQSRQAVSYQSGPCQDPTVVGTTCGSACPCRGSAYSRSLEHSWGPRSGAAADTGEIPASSTGANASCSCYSCSQGDCSTTYSTTCCASSGLLPALLCRRLPLEQVQVPGFCRFRRP